MQAKRSSYFSLIQAKRVIALVWKNIQRPVLSQWIKEMSDNIVLEKLTYAIRGKAEDFKRCGPLFGNL